MKKILSMMVAAATFITTAASAGTNVPVYWPFSIGSIQVTAMRAGLDEANKKQNDYNFVVVHKPGAGSAVAAKHVAGATDLELMGVSSSFFMRPVFFPESSHSVKDLRPVAMMSTGMPAMVVSKKYKSVEDLKKQKKVTIGMNHGSITNLVALALKNALPGVEVVMVPFNGTNEPTLQVVNGTLDLNVAFSNHIDQFVKTGQLNVIGVTGTKSVRGYQTFAQQGLKGFDDIIVEYWIMASSKVSDEQAKKLHKLLSSTTAAGSKEWAMDEATVVKGQSFEDMNRRYWQQAKYWADLKSQLESK